VGIKVEKVRDKVRKVKVSKKKDIWVARQIIMTKYRSARLRG
jgi:hypothetical protein